MARSLYLARYNETGAEKGADAQGFPNGKSNMAGKGCAAKSLCKNIHFRNIIFELFDFILSLILGVGLVAAVLGAFSIKIGITFPKSGPASSLSGLWNKIAENLGRNDFIILNQYKNPGDYSLAVYILCALSIIIAYFAIKSRNKYFLTLYSLPIVFIGILLNRWPDGNVTLFLLIGIFAFYMRNRLIQQGIREISSIVVGIALTSCLVYAISFNAGSKAFVEKAMPYLDLVGKSTNTIVEHLKYGAENKADKGTALEITMDKPQEMWLRGYVGENLGVERTAPLRNSKHYDLIGITATMHNMGISSLGQLNAVAGAIAWKNPAVKNNYAGGKKKAKSDENLVKIKVKDANRKYMYIPYEIEYLQAIGKKPIGVFAGSGMKEQGRSESTKAYLKNNSKSYSDSFIRSNGIFPGRAYSFTVGSEKVSHWTDIAGQYMKSAYGDHNPELEAYRKAESHINVMAYKNYLQMEPSLLLGCVKALGNPGDQSNEHMDYRTAIEKIRTFFKDKVVPLRGDSKLNKNVATSVVDDGKGSDRQIAHMATAMFRYYGIPARYVEGFQLGKADVAKMKPSEPYLLPMKRFHAWTEIYIDGVGWVPIEVNPTYENVMTQADLSKGIENSRLAPTLNPYVKEPNVNRGTQDDVIKEENKASVRVNIALMKRILIYLLILLLIIILIYFICKTIIREMGFRSGKNRRLAVQKIFAYALSRSLSVDDEFNSIGLKAAYSKETISAGEHKTMLLKLKSLRRGA